MSRFSIHPTIWLAVLLLGLHGGLLYDSARLKSATVDELSHLASGLYTLNTLDFRMHRTTPPLPNLVCALPVYFTQDYQLAYDNQNWNKAIWNGSGSRFVEANPKTFHTALMRGRLGTMMLSILLCAVIFLWARLLWGAWPALGVLLLAVLEPNLLAHGRLTTTDTAAALGFALVGFVLHRYLNHISWVRYGVVGLALGLAWLCKHSAAVLFPTVFLVLLLSQAADPIQWVRPRFAKGHWAMRRFCAAACLAAGLLGISFVVIWLGYGLEVGEPIQPPKPWLHYHLPSAIADYFGVVILLFHPIEAMGSNPVWLALRDWLPAFDHWEGFFANRSHLQSGHLSYFMGQRYLFGNIWYYPVLFLLKTPLALLAVYGLGLLLLIARRVRLSYESALALFAIPLVYWLIIIFYDTANIGFRHTLPVTPFLLAGPAGAVMKYAGEGLQKMLHQRRVNLESVVAAAAVLAGVGMLAETGIAHPHYLAFFNALVKDPYQASSIAADSNLDWGQDLLRLKQAIESEKIDTPYLFYFGPKELPSAYGVPHHSGLELSHLPPGGYVISATLYRGIHSQDVGELIQPFKLRRPDQILAPSLFYYEYPFASGG